MKTYTKYTALVSTILLTSALAGPANAETPTTAPLDKVPTDTSQIATVKAENIPLTFDRTTVTTTPAAKVAAPVAAPVSAQATVAGSNPTEPKLAAPVTGQAAPKLAPAPAPVTSASGKGASIAAAAYAQLGVSQDCTMLVTNSLAAVGVNFHGWPAGYFSLGTTVSAADAQPGDLTYYADGGAGLAHIAVYVGGGKAVHGGWNGGTTSLQSVNVGSGPVYIRVA